MKMGSTARTPPEYEVAVVGDEQQLCYIFSHTEVKSYEPDISMVDFRKNQPYKGEQLKFC